MAVLPSGTPAEPLLRQALTALDTAEGVCQLIAANIKPKDLAECRGEIRAAQFALACALGMLE
jgi:hypothetical protein